MTGHTDAYGKRSKGPAELHAERITGATGVA